MQPKESNLSKWILGGALIGLASGLLQLKYTWGAEDIGSVFGSLVGGALIGGIAAKTKNYYSTKSK